MSGKQSSRHFRSWHERSRQRRYFSALRRVQSSALYLEPVQNFILLTSGQIELKPSLTIDASALPGGIQINGNNNSRDLGNIIPYGENILQQSAPTIYASLFLINNQANFINGLEYARREYTKFKNKFIDLATTLPGLDINDAKSSVDEILTSINAVKNNSFSWYYSDMVPYGDNKNTITYSIINPLQYQYEISQVYNDNQLSGIAVLVYLNGVQLINTVDFTFPQDRSAIILDSSITLNVDDRLVIILE